MTQVLVLGSGLLGESLVRVAPDDCDVIQAARRDQNDENRPYCNIADPNSVYRLFDEIPSPDIVVNCAAMSGVDACEECPDGARSANALGVKYLAERCKMAGAYFIHISTDYVFSGDETDLLESDPITPCSVYGATKAEGEFYALTCTEHSCVIRTAWLFGHARQDFVSSVVQKLLNDENVSVIYKQVGTPTYSDDLAEAIWKLIYNLDRAKNRIYHFTNKGSLTRYDMVQKMKDILKSSSSVTRAEEESIPSWIAMRPKRSVMSCRLIEQDFNLSIRSWEDAFIDYCGKRKSLE
ncbi:MAG: NAD(P)-dependent oxidoreductase [Candidatus Omnitrophica bacterium]|nr:NAD(P)-dependent oxidoreductase [Candidatus Omnitrophota bacterium]